MGFIGNGNRPELTSWFCIDCGQSGMHKHGEHYCDDVPQVERLARERDAAIADAEALRLAVREFAALVIDNAPTFGTDDHSLREYAALCKKTAHTLAVLAGARGPR